MDINDLTIGQARELAALFGVQSQSQSPIRNGMIGKYVIVRCRDAGVHSGVLESHDGRECVLTDARRLWRWAPANGSKWLSGVAVMGLDGALSKVSVAVPRIHLTENCEIIGTTTGAEALIRGVPANG